MRIIGIIALAALTSVSWTHTAWADDFGRRWDRPDEPLGHYCGDNGVAVWTGDSASAGFGVHHDVDEAKSKAIDDAQRNDRGVRLSAARTCNELGATVIYTDTAASIGCREHAGKYMCDLIYHGLVTCCVPR